MKNLILIATGFAILFASARAQSPQPVPTGLWQSTESGFVMRVERCSDGFCGFTAGWPPSADKDKPACGKQTFKDFRWNTQKHRWEGSMEPPTSNTSISATADTDGNTALTIHGHMLFIAKSMAFKPFLGKIDASCHIQ